MIRIVNSFCIWVLLMCLMAGPAVAQISYCKDVIEPGNPGGLGTCDIIGGGCSTDSQCAGGALTCLDPSLKTWDEEWDLPNGESIDMDIWLNDVPETLITGGCFITYDPALVNITSVIPFDVANGGAWDTDLTNSFEVEPGQWFLSMGQFSCVTPDGDGDIILAQATFTRLADGNADITISTIPDFDTVVGCFGATYDPQLSPNIVALPGAGGCPDCDDGISCTDDVCNVDTCDNTPNDSLCDDGDLCTTDTCDPVTDCDNAPVVCPPGEACDPADGVCKECTVDGDCDDGDVCNGDETCDAGTCLAGTPLDCDDLDLCTTDTCDPVTGCDNPPVVCDPGEACDPADGVCKECTVDGDCDDGDICNGDETCDAGTCLAGTPLDCDDVDLCTTDTCDPVTGCDNPPVVCDPGEACDPADGVCKACTVDGDCDDGDVCNGDETCDAGTCQAGTPLVCDDGDACNGDETCDSVGGCQAGTPPDCDDGNLCTTDTCDPVTGCDNAPVVCDPGEACDPADGVCKACTVDGDCDDGDVCTGDETCDAGTCLAGMPLDCDDLDLCTTDSCDPVTGCDNPPVVCDPGEACDPADGVCKGCTVDEDCDDGDVCNGDETCDAGTCLPGTPLGCDDEDACNGVETCDPVGGCQAGTPPDCDDGDLCTTDSCDPVTGCDNTPVVCPPGEACDPADGVCKGCTVDEDCDDGDVCNGDETCDAGTCLPGTPLDCDDGDLCTTDSCDPVTGCDNTPVVCDPGEACDPADGVCKGCTVDEDCDDGDVCTGDETCDAGTCLPGTPLVCDDGDVCNGDETCDPVGGCQAGTPPDCDDGDLCTTDDGCDPVTGCIYTPVECPEGEACDPADGQCKPTGGDVISYVKDFLEPGNPGGLGTCDILATPCSTDSQCAAGAFECLNSSLKTWDETWEMPAGETVEMDIWLNNVPESMLTAGCYITYDTDLVDIASVVPNDTANGGQWDAGFTESFEFAPGEWFLSLGDFSCLEPDGDGDILLARVTFQCQSVGDVGVTIQTIPDFGTVTGCSLPTTIYDSQISPNTVTISQISGEICTVPGDCPDDGNLCTIADCPDGTCVYNPVVCDDPDLCMVSNCNPDNGECESSPVTCDDGDVCTGDETCDPVDGCQPGTPLVCDDGDRCTIDGCDPETGCEFVAVDCSSLNDLCNVGVCNPESGFCVSDPIVDCSDGDLCTQDICNPADGTCSNPPEDCDDGVECTNDSCDDPATGCLNEPIPGFCDDNADCTIDTCDPVADCQYEDTCPAGDFCNIDADPPACQLAPTGPCRIKLFLEPANPNVKVLGTVQFDVTVDGTGICEDPSYSWEISDSGCTGDATGSSIGGNIDGTGFYTAGDEEGTDTVRVTDVNNGDVCETAQVFVTLGPRPPVGGGGSGGCTTDEECDDGEFCNGEESCVEKDCVDGTPPCGAELCDEDTDTCINCLEDADCDDDLDCTDDSCVDETCVNMPNDENCPDDGLYCNGEELCDVDDGCTSTGDPCGANETCDEDNDTCVTETECAIDVLRDSLPKSSLSVLPALFRIETVGIEPLNGLTPVTIACESDETIIFPFLTSAILQTGKLVIPSFGTNTTVIFQAGVILPAWITGSQGMQTEICTVTVGDCQSTDSLELNYLPFPLSE